MKISLKNKKAIVCGGTNGIGYSIAQKFSELGATITLIARNKNKLIKTKESLYGDNHNFICANFSDPNELQKKITENKINKNYYSILINNTGGPPPGSWENWKNEDFLSAIQANMLTPINLIQRVLPSMIKQNWGRIVNITSGAVKAPIPALGLSNSARAGLTGFVAGVSRQVAKDGVLINNVLPGVHDTDRIKGFDEKLAKDLNISIDEARRRKALTIPVGSYGDAEGFGNLCAFLCSEHAAFIVGQNIVVDGGAINATI